MRSLRLTAGAVLSILTTGCYALQPVAETSVPEGTNVAFDLNDVGRVALGGAIGPSIARVEGRLVRRDSSSYVVAVSSVNYLAGGSQVWSGEPITVKPEYIGTAYSRRFSKSRTLAASALGIGAVAFIVTRSIIGSGDPESRPTPIDSAATIRGRRP